MWEQTAIRRIKSTRFPNRVSSPLRRQGARGVAPPAHRAGAPGATCYAPGATCQNAKMVYIPLRRQGAQGVAPPAHRAGALHTPSASAGAPGAAERRRGLRVSAT